MVGAGGYAHDSWGAGSGHFNYYEVEILKDHTRIKVDVGRSYDESTHVYVNYEQSDQVGQGEASPLAPGDLLGERRVPELRVERWRAHRGRRHQRGAEGACPTPSLTWFSPLQTSYSTGTGAALPSLPFGPSLTPAPGGERYNYCTWSHYTK